MGTLYDPETGLPVFHYHRLSGEERSTLQANLTDKKPPNKGERDA